MSNIKMWDSEGMSEQEIKEVLAGDKPVLVRRQHIHIPFWPALLSVLLCFFMPFVFHVAAIAMSVRMHNNIHHFSTHAIVLSIIICVFSFFYLYWNCEIRLKKVEK